MEFLCFQSPKGIVMAYAFAPKDYSRAPLWRDAIRNYGLPRDPESEISALEYPDVAFVGWDGRVFALDTQVRRRRWISTLRHHGLAAESQRIDFAFHEGFLFATWNNRIFKLDPTDGRVLRIQRAHTHLAVLID